MVHAFHALWNDDYGFIVSAELVLFATIAVIGLIVGLAEVQNAVVGELNDIGEAIGSLNQSFFFHGHRSQSTCGGLKAKVPGSSFKDFTDDGDGNECAISCFPAEMEQPKSH